MSELDVDDVREHARKSPSSAARWMVCTMSIEMSELFPIRTTSDAAEEGTAAHELLEKSWKAKTPPYSSKWRHQLFNKIWPVTNDMVEAVTIAYEFMLEYQLKGYKVTSERRVSIDATGEFGTIDIVCWNEKTGHLVCADYKHGRGVFVHVFENKQLRLYALGVMDTLKIRDKVNNLTLVIIQPRMKYAPSYYEESMIKLSAFERKVKRISSDIDNGRTMLVAGPHCLWCQAVTCRERAEWSFEQLGFSLEYFTKGTKNIMKDPRALTDNEINSLMLNVSAIDRWINQIQIYAKELASKNRLKDFKIVETKGKRKWKNEHAAVLSLVRLGYSREEVTKSTIQTFDVLSGLFLTKDELNRFLDKHTFKPDGFQILVDKNDPRPAFTPQTVAEDFCDI